MALFTNISDSIMDGSSVCLPVLFIVKTGITMCIYKKLFMLCFPHYFIIAFSTIIIFWSILNNIIVNNVIMKQILKNSLNYLLIPVMMDQGKVLWGYICKHYDYVADGTNCLKHHIYSFHDRLGYNCQQCDYEASWDSYLKKHVKLYHNGI